MVKSQMTVDFVLNYTSAFYILNRLFEKLLGYFKYIFHRSSFMWVTNYVVLVLFYVKVTYYIIVFVLMENLFIKSSEVLILFILVYKTVDDTQYLLFQVFKKEKFNLLYFELLSYTRVLF